MQQLIDLETELHTSATRANTVRLNELLHDAFVEIGYSGTVYAKGDIIDSLVGEGPIDYTIWSDCFECCFLNDDLVQLVYREARKDKDGSLSRRALRSSLWQREQGKWQIRFHQATPVSGFD